MASMRRELSWRTACSWVVVCFLASCGPDSGHSADRARARQRAMRRDVVVFCDVTKSLTSGEFAMVKRFAGKVVSSYRPPARVDVFPIYLETGRGDALAVFDMKAAMRPSQRRRSVAERDEQIKALEDRLQVLHEDLNSVGADPNRSCIINALAHAAELFAGVDGEGRTVKELVIISDMVEECDASSLGLVRLNRRAIEEEISRAEHCSGMPSLQGVRVTVVTPFEARPVRRPDRPDQHSLERFWKAMFRCAGFSEKDLADRERFYFRSALPRRFEVGGE